MTRPRGSRLHRLPLLDLGPVEKVAVDCSAHAAQKVRQKCGNLVPWKVVPYAENGLEWGCARRDSNPRPAD